MKKLLPFLSIILVALFFISCTKNQLVSPSSENQNLTGKVSPNVLQCNEGQHWDYYLKKCVITCSSGYHNDSITGACVLDGNGKIPVNLQTRSVTDVTIKNTLISTFNNLASSGVNLVELSAELGLGYTITADSIDFVNVVMTWDANDLGGKAITANFKSNSNANNIGYGFTMFTDDTLMGKPIIIKTSKNNYLKYYSLTEGLITTISNYASSSYVFSSIYGSYYPGSGGEKSIKATCDVATIQCMTDLYSNHGWVSIWAFVQTAFYPPTAVAVAATCAVHNCWL